MNKGFIYSVGKNEIKEERPDEVLYYDKKQYMKIYKTRPILNDYINQLFEFSPNVEDGMWYMLTMWAMRKDGNILLTIR